MPTGVIVVAQSECC